MLERGQKEQANCLKGRALQERNRKILCGLISSPTLPMQEYLYFTVSKSPTNDKNFEYSKEQIQEIILGANKQVHELHPLLKGKSNPTTKHPDAVTLKEDIHCKLCTASQASEMFDRRIQVGSIA